MRFWNSLSPVQKVRWMLRATTDLCAFSMFVWLFWFVYQYAEPQPIWAIGVSSEADGTNTLEMDIRYLSFHGGKGADGTFITFGQPESIVLPDTPVKHSLKVYYVSMPAVAFQRNADLHEQIEPLTKEIVKHWEKQESDILVALDMTRIDSDHNWSIYGHRPYEAFEKHLHDEMVKIDPESKKTYHVYVLTSSADGQKSWYSETKGVSAFAYYLRLGLTKPKTNGPKIENLKQLRNFVQTNVRNWARTNRKSNQEPQLIAMKRAESDLENVRVRPMRFDEDSEEDAGKTSLPAQRGDTEDPEKPISDPKTKTKELNSDPKTKTEEINPPQNETPSSPEPTSDLDSIVKAWEDHEKLMKLKPWRFAPNSWRQYEQELIQLENKWRLHQFRPAGFQQSSPPDLKAEFERVNREKDKLKRALDSDSLRFTFATLGIDKKEVSEDSWKALEKEVEYFLTSPEPAPPEENKANDKPDVVKTDKQTPAKLLKPEEYSQNVDLSAQLYVWAYRFVERFDKRNYFVEDPRKGALIELVGFRRESIEPHLGIGRDPRGIEFWKDEFSKADAIRRLEQDKLFLEEPPTPLNPESLASAYKSAFSMIKEYDEFRDAYEEAAWKFPYLIDSVCRQYFLDSSLGSAEEIKNAREVLRSVRDAHGAFLAARNALELPEGFPLPRNHRDLCRKLKEHIDAFSNSSKFDDWSSIDARLVLPWISPAERRVLLERIEKRLVKDDWTPRAPKDEIAPSEDLGRLIHGLVLAEFDRAMIPIETTEKNEKTDAKNKSTNTVTGILDSILEDQKSRESALKAWNQHRNSWNEAREGIASEVYEFVNGQNTENFETITEPKSLTKFDNLARTRSIVHRIDSAETAKSLDAGPDRWYELARKRRFDFQIRRLIDDFVEKSEIAELLDKHDQIRDELKDLPKPEVRKLALKFENNENPYVVDNIGIPYPFTVTANSGSAPSMPGSEPIGYLRLEKGKIKDDEKDLQLKGSRAFEFVPPSIAVKVDDQDGRTEFKIEQRSPLPNGYPDASIPVLAFFRGRSRTIQAEAKVKGNDQLPCEVELRQSEEQVAEYNRLISEAGMKNPALKVENQNKSKANRFAFLTGGKVDIELILTHTGKIDASYKVRLIQTQYLKDGVKDFAGLKADKPEVFEGRLKIGQPERVFKRAFSEEDKIPKKSDGGYRELKFDVSVDGGDFITATTARIYYESEFNDVFTVKRERVDGFVDVVYSGISNEPILLDQISGTVGNLNFQGQGNKMGYPKTNQFEDTNQFLKGRKKSFKDENFDTQGGRQPFSFFIKPKPSGKGQIPKETPPIYKATFP
ncbi:hypothetical protein GC170_14860 [bacterium]|nr:hypothetical protein [bacterium]